MDIRITNIEPNYTMENIMGNDDMEFKITKLIGYDIDFVLDEEMNSKVYIKSNNIMDTIEIKKHIENKFTHILDIEYKSISIDSISDLIKEYWYTTGEKHEAVRKLANILESMADKIQIKEYEYQVNKEGIKLFTTKWEDMFGELSEEFWEKYREDKKE